MTVYTPLRSAGLSIVCMRSSSVSIYPLGCSVVRYDHSRAQAVMLNKPHEQSSWEELLEDLRV